MDIFTEDDLRDLVTMRSKNCVSMYMPAFRAGSETQQNPIRFKNLVAEAEEMLVARGMRPTEAASFLEPARRFLRNSAFWQYQAEGLACFISPGLVKMYRLPEHFPQKVMVSSRFHIKPMLPLLSGNTRFYLLILDTAGVKFFSGTRFMIDKIESEKIPRSMDETLGFDTMDKNTQFSSYPASISQSKVNVFGYGRQTDKKKINIMNYFYRVNGAIFELLQNSNDPLVIAGVEYLHPLYRETNTYPNLVETGIEQGCSDMSIEELHQRAWAVVEPLFQTSKIRDTTNYKILAGEKKSTAADDLRTIVTGAQHGRVATLFVTDGESVVWGRYDDSKQDIEIHPQEQPGDEDLLDRAAINTLLRGGTVYVVNPEEMPGKAPIAALLRY